MLAVVFLFLQSWRATLIPMISVPVSLIGCTAGLWLCGFSINTLPTLFAMTLAIGIVVDDAIVVLENVDRLMIHERLSPRDAAVKAMQEVSRALVAIVLVLSSVFVPVAFLGGMAGELYRQFAITVAMAVVISGFNALTSRRLSALFLKAPDKKHAKPAFFVFFNRCLDKITAKFVHHRAARALPQPCLRGHSGRDHGCCVGTRADPPTSFVPSEDQGLVRMVLRLPEGSAYPRTQKLAAEVGAKVQKLPGVDSVLTEAGRDATSSDFRPDVASITAKLKLWGNAPSLLTDVRQMLQKIANARTDAIGTITLPPPFRDSAARTVSQALLRPAGTMTQGASGRLGRIRRSPPQASGTHVAPQLPAG